MQRQRNNRINFIFGFEALRNFSVLICTSVLLPACIFFPAQALAKTSTFPFLGEITADNVNVRAGQSANFERLIQLNMSDQVVVLDSQYSWYKIRLPKQAKAFISKKYVQILVDDRGIVLGDKVNVRSGPETSHSILGQLARGDEVKVLETMDDWYAIAPWDGSYGWVAEEYVRFKSNDVSAYQPPAAKSEENLKEILAEPIKVIEEIIAPQPKEELKVEGKVVYLSEEEGYVLENAQARYKLKAPQNILEKFVKKEVKIEGKVFATAMPGETLTAVTVSKIELIL